MPDKCNLCDSTAPDAKVDWWDSNLDVRGVRCSLCGNYRITADAYYGIVHLDPHQRFLISCWVREKIIRDISPQLIISDRDSTQVPGIIGIRYTEILSNAVSARVPERLSRALLNLSVLGPGPGQLVTLSAVNRFSVYAQSKQEMDYIVYALQEEKLLNVYGAEGAQHLVSLTPRGWDRVASLEIQGAASKQGFVAMSFHESMDTAWDDGLRPGISLCAYDPLRIDRREHNEKICDLIISEIRKSRFLVADVTGQRQGVYFEAGFALGLGLPVIWTCQEADQDNCHFDTRQYAHIFWVDPSDLAKRLQARIEATIGRGD